MAVDTLPITARAVGRASSRRGTALGRASSRRGTALGCAVAVASCSLLVVQLHGVALGAVFADLRLGWVLAAVLATAASLAAAAHNLSAFAPIRLPALDTLRAQLAVCGLRVIAPSAVTTPAIGARFLTRSGLSVAEALAVVGTAQAAQLVMTIAVVAVLAGAGSSGLDIPAGATGLAAGAAAVVVAIAVLVGRRVVAVRKIVTAVLGALGVLAAHLRQRPARVLTGLGASGALTVAHVVAFACCVHAVGGHAALLSLTAVYLGAASAGSLVPTPAGVGPVEAAMIGGLCAAGVSLPTATGATVLTRLVTVWAPAIPGWLAIRSLRRSGLL